MIFQIIPQAYAAASTSQWSQWTGECIENTPEGNVATIRGVECLFRNLINPIPSLLALVAVGMIVFAGIRLLTAGADPKAYKAAWDTFTWAVIGLVLLAAAWLIIILIQRFTGANISTFTVGLPTSTP